MISFVAYFSSAEDAEGYVVVDGRKMAKSAFTGGPALECGTYRIEADGIVRVDCESEVASDECVKEVLSPETIVAR